MKTMMIILMTSLSLSANAFRCGDEVFSKGDTLTNVIAACGQPNSQYSDVWGEQGTATFNLEDGRYTLTILQDQIVQVDFHRK